ncbi:MAG: outer membrane beta-barrel protein [Acidobacteriota bacterium]
MKKIALFLVLSCAAPAAFAQYAELWFSGGQSLLQNRGLGTLATIGGSKDDVRLTDGFKWGFRIGFNGDNHFGHEVQYSYSRTHLEIGTGTAMTSQGMAIHAGGYNYLVYANTEGARVRPFATGGVQFSNYVPPGSSAYSGGGSNKFGVNYGGGVKVRLASIYALRFDLRQATTPKPNFGLALKEGWIRQTEVSAGFGIVF